MKKILLLEPNKEQDELFSNWLKEEGYDANSLDSLREVQVSLSKDKFDILLVDIDEPEITEPSLKLIQALKSEPRFADLPIVILTYRKDIKKIISAIESKADSFVLKPFETDAFLKRIETIFKQIELKKQGKKVLDLNYVNYLIALADEADREDFFLLAPPIFNIVILDKIRPYLGEPVIAQIIKRCNELLAEDYAFMREIKFCDTQIFMDGVDRASKDVPVNRLTFAFRDYTYAFLQLVRALTSNILMERGGGG